MGRPLRVLVVEDDQDDAFLVLRELRRAGYDPAWRRVAKPQGLRAALAGEDWDVITCDSVMPGFGAPEALQIIGDSGFEGPVILVSGEAGTEAALSAIEAGAHDFVSKHELANLVPVIERVLRECEKRPRRADPEAELAAGEQLVRDRLAELELIYRTAPVGLAFLDSQLRYVRVNEQLAAMNGQPVEAHIRRTARELDPSIADVAETLVRRVIETGEAVLGVELAVATPARPGEERNFLVNYSPVEAEDGSRLGVAVVVQDVTELKRSDEAYRTVVEQSRQGLMIVQGAQIVFANDAMLALLGCDLARLRAMEASEGIELVVEEDRDKVVAGTTALAHGESRTASIEVRVRRPDGETRWVEASLARIRYRSLPAIQVVAADITERKRIEREAEFGRRAEAIVSRCARRLLEASLSETAAVITGILAEVAELYDADDASMWETPEGSEVTNRTYEWRRAGVRIERRLPKEVPLDRFAAATQHLLDRGQLLIREEDPIASAATGVRAHASVSVVVSGRVAGVVSLLWVERPAPVSEAQLTPLRMVGDLIMTALARNRAYDEMALLNEDLERRVAARTAQLESVNRELKSFGYSVSHDLRAPLRSIGGFSRALEEDYAGVLDEQGREYVGRICRSADRMARLVDDLLELSRVGEAGLTVARVDLSSIVRSVLDDLSRAEPRRAVEAVVTDGLVALGDERLLRVALENLVGNAWKYTSKHGRARIDFGAIGSDGARVYYVRDDGAGFDMRQAAKLFGAFQRLHGVTEFEGTGVGLATVQRIVHRHGGRIWAEGAVEKGATFYFTLGVPSAEARRE